MENCNDLLLRSFLNSLKNLVLGWRFGTLKGACSEFGSGCRREGHDMHVSHGSCLDYSFLQGVGFGLPGVGLMQTGSLQSSRLLCHFNVSCGCSSDSDSISKLSTAAPRSLRGR
jgi:hypothetical protein